MGSVLKKTGIVLLVLMVLIANNTRAQYNETIQSDRPGQAIGPNTVGQHMLQTQTGLDFGESSRSATNYTTNFLAPNTGLRFGLTPHFELNTAWEYRSDRYMQYNMPTESSGLSLAAIGARFNILDGQNSVPVIGLQLSFKLPISAPAYNAKYVAPNAVLIISEKISDAFSALVNMGINYDGNTARPTGLYVVNIGYSISDDWSTFVEGYGTLSGSSLEAKWDAGLAYLCNNNLQLDIYGGASRNTGLTEYFASIGVSYRIQVAKKTAK